jgi:ABC-type polysaccharide/polyol phosphate export permease
MMKLRLGLRDFFDAMRQSRAWFYLGFWEVKQRYQRSVLGPWWITISMLIFIVVMGVIYSRLFHQDVTEYLPFFTAGFLFLDLHLFDNQ